MLCRSLFTVSNLYSCRQVRKSYINLPHKYFLENICGFSSTSVKIETSSVLNLNPEEFAEVLKKNETERCMIWYNKPLQKFQVSHDFLQEICEYLVKSKSNKQEAIFFELGKRTNQLLTAFVSNSTRGQAHGGIKLWPYNSVKDLVKEGLRLSDVNTVKAALADLWIGGGKGIIPEPLEKKHLNPNFRQDLCYDYGDFLSGLNGCFVGSADAGLNIYDINHIHSRTRYITGMIEDVGGLGNPAFTVGKGIVCVMEAVLDFLKMGDLNGKSVAVQGAGSVGQVIISELLDNGVGSVYVTDCSQKRVDDLKDFLSKKAKGRLEVVKVPFGDNKILSRNCHILSPCAIGNLVTKETLPLIETKIVCGVAYNQLADDVNSKLLTERGITFVADDIANRMGLVHDCVEAQGRLASDPLIDKHFSKNWEHSIFAVTKKILQKAKDDNIVLDVAAKLLADQQMNSNPFWLNRSELIINSLIENEWHKSKDFWRKRSHFPGARNV